MNNNNSLRYLLLIALVYNLTGCAAPSVYTDMLPISYNISNTHDKTVSVSVNGGNEDEISISNNTLKQALVESIIKSRVFKGVVIGGETDSI